MPFKATPPSLVPQSDLRCFVETRYSGRSETVFGLLEQHRDESGCVRCLHVDVCICHKASFISLRSRRSYCSVFIVIALEQESQPNNPQFLCTKPFASPSAADYNLRLESVVNKNPKVGGLIRSFFRASSCYCRLRLHVLLLMLPSPIIFRLASLPSQTKCLMSKGYGGGGLRSVAAEES